MGLHVGRRRRNERGVAAIMVAVCMLALLVSTAMVLDFGLVRLDRQQNKLAADDAVMAGLRAAAKPQDDKVYNQSAVCAAVDFLRANKPDLAGLPLGLCASAAPNASCKPGDTSSYVDYEQAAFTGPSGKTYTVSVKMPYLLSDGSFPEESYSSLAADQGDPAQQGCDQLGVVITQRSKPGLGSLASTQDLVTRIRSAGRVIVDGGDKTPALLLLERTKCGVLVVGSGGPAKIRVYGSSAGAEPGSIHADSSATDGSTCGTGPGKQVFQGKQSDGLVAYGSNDGRPGTITSVAGQNLVDDAIVFDGLTNVYATTAANELSSGTKTAPGPHPAVTRKPVDVRYLGGVSAATRAAYAEWTRNHAAPGAPWTRYGCSPSATDLAITSPVYIDCNGSSGITLGTTSAPAVIKASRIFFNGYIKNGNIYMPNATEVYVSNTDDSGNKINSAAISLTNNTAFCLRATSMVTTPVPDGCDVGAPLPGKCSTTPTGSATDKAQLLLRRGMIDGSGNTSLLRLCNTEVILEGGDIGDGTASHPGGCLPATNGTAPTATPCSTASTTAGTGQVSSSGYTDWSPPNQFDDMSSLSFAQRRAAWFGGEDLALWSESYGGPSSPTFSMAGGGQMNTHGVFMLPNANPFQVKGGGAQDMRDAQYIVTSFSVDGGAILSMRADPYNAIGIPELEGFLLVR